MTGQNSMPNHIDKLLFIIGLGTIAVSQAVMTLLSGQLHAQTPIDFAHWLLLVGAFLLIPLAGRLPRDASPFLAGIILLVGIVCVIGMCVIDFIFWSLPPSEQKTELVNHLVATPAIWQPFIVIGPNWIFHTGLVLVSLTWFKTSKLGTAIVIAGTVASALTMIGLTRWLVVVGYTLITIGFFINFERLKSTANKGL